MHGTARTAITAAAATLLAVSPVFATAAHADHTTVAHWTLDSEPTMVDSEGGHDGVASRVKLVKGHNGNAYSFDGKRSVAYASDSEDLNPEDDAVRISLWIVPRRSEVSGSGGDVPQIRVGEETADEVGQFLQPVQRG